MHRPGLWHTLISLLFCSLIAHLSILKGVVDLKRGVLLVGSVLDHSWVLRAETWAQRAIGAKEIPRNFPKLLVAPSTEPLVPRRCSQHLPSSPSPRTVRTRSLHGQGPLSLRFPCALVSSYRHFQVATLFSWVKCHKWD